MSCRVGLARERGCTVAELRKQERCANQAMAASSGAEKRAGLSRRDRLKRNVWVKAFDKAYKKCMRRR